MQALLAMSIISNRGLSKWDAVDRTLKEAKGFKLMAIWLVSQLCCACCNIIHLVFCRATIYPLTIINFSFEQLNSTAPQESNEESLLKDDSTTNKSTKGREINCLL